MSQSLASASKLTLTKPVGILSELETYIIQSLSEQLKKEDNRWIGERLRGADLLSKYLTDYVLTFEMMSYKLRNIKPWGMSECMARWPIQVS